MRDILEKSISILNIKKDVFSKLILNKIEIIFDLCNYSRIELVDLGFTNEEVNEIIVRLQLAGLDLKRNHAKKNTLIDFSNWINKANYKVMYYFILKFY